MSKIGCVQHDCDKCKEEAGFKALLFERLTVMGFGTDDPISGSECCDFLAGLYQEIEPPG